MRSLLSACACFRALQCVQRMSCCCLAMIYVPGSRGFNEGYETSKSLWLASFVTQRDHRINSRGAASGDVAREQSDNGQKQPDRGKRNSIGLTDAKEFRLKQARECHSERRAHDEARQCEPESLAKSETVDASPLRAERHADADFPRALASGVRHDAIDADGGEQHGKKTERAGERSRDASKKCAELHGDGKRIHIVQWQLRIELMDGLFHRRSHG